MNTETDEQRTLDELRRRPNPWLPSPHGEQLRFITLSEQVVAVYYVYEYKEPLPHQWPHPLRALRMDLVNTEYLTAGYIRPAVTDHDQEPSNKRVLREGDVEAPPEGDSYAPAVLSRFLPLLDEYLRQHPLPWNTLRGRKIQLSWRATREEVEALRLLSV